MKSTHILAVGTIFLICVISAIYIFNSNNTNKDSEITKTSDKNKTEIQMAIEEFKNNPGFRNEPAKILVPLLKIGMTTDDVEHLLGKPDSERQLDEGTAWGYGLFYSQFIDVHFDSDNKVEKIQASAPGLGNDQSGSYLLEKDNNQTKSIIGTWQKESASQEGHNYPGDKDWELKVTFEDNGHFIWDSKRKDQNGNLVDESLSGKYTIEKGFMVNYYFEKPSEKALERLPELFAYWPNKTLGQQTFRFQNGKFLLVHDGGKLWLSMKKI